MPGSQRFLWTILFYLSILAGSSASAATTGSPDRIRVAIQSASISTDDVNYIPVFSSDNPSGIDLDKIGRPEFGRNEEVPAGTYHTLRLVITQMSWHATWTPLNPSPCNGATSGESSGAVDLGGRTVFYFKSSSFGGNTLTYYRSAPPTSGFIGDHEHPFALASPIDVLNGRVTSVNLVIGVSDTLSCDGLNLFSPAASGNASPVGGISGQATIMNEIQAAYWDPVNTEIGVTGRGTDSVTVYDGLADGNAVPSRTLIGPETRLNDPFGIALHTDINRDEIAVANSGNDSITIFRRTAALNERPLRVISGFQTGLSRPAGLYLNSIDNEIVVANQGNNTVTVHHLQSPAENSPPLRTISNNYVVTTLNNGIRLTESGGLGSVIALLSPSSYASGAALASAVDKAIEAAVSVDTDLSVTYDNDTNRFTITVDILGAGISSLEIHWTAPDSTAAGVLGYGSIDSGGLVAGSDSISDVGVSSGPVEPCGVFVDTRGDTNPSNDETIVTSPATNTVLIYRRDPGANREMYIARILGGSSSMLARPCGVWVNTVEDELIIANEEGNSVATFSRVAAGDTPPLRSLAGPNTGLNRPSGIFLDSVNNRLGVVGGGPQVVMQLFPEIYPSAEIDDATPSPFSGDYNIVTYGVRIRGINGRGVPIPVVVAKRGTARFDVGEEWPRFDLRFDTQVEREIIAPDCVVNRDVGVDLEGLFGMTPSGGFYVFIPPTRGSFHGAFLSDGSAFAASMIDGSDSMQIIYGVRGAGTTAPYLTSDGSPTGSAAQYALAHYSNDVFLIRRPADDDILRYFLGIGMANTDAASILARQAANFVTALNPLDEFTGIVTPGPAFRDAFLRTAKQTYLPAPGGFLETAIAGLSGPVSSDGGRFVFMRSTTQKEDVADEDSCNIDIGFGFGFRQKPPGTFQASSFTGTYFLSGFGDRFDESTRLSRHRSSAATITFDGVGRAEIQWLENETGILSSDKVSLTYLVRSSTLATEPGTGPSTVDVIDLFIRDDADPVATALVGEDGKTLALFKTLNPIGFANPTRFLGLALFQSS